MLYRLLYPFHTSIPVLNVTGYITFRTAAASLTALAISLALGPWLIRKLREFQIGQVIRHEGPATHAPNAKSARTIFISPSTPPGAVFVSASVVLN